MKRQGLPILSAFQITLPLILYFTLVSTGTDCT